MLLGKCGLWLNEGIVSDERKTLYTFFIETVFIILRMAIFYLYLLEQNKDNRGFNLTYSYMYLLSNLQFKMHK